MSTRTTNWREFETGGREARQRTTLGPRPTPLTDWQGKPIVAGEVLPVLGGKPKPEEGHYISRERDGRIGAATFLRLERERTAPRPVVAQSKAESTEDWLKRHKIGVYASA